MKPYTDIEQSRLSTMTQEEKARRFDEAFRLAKEQHQYPWVRRSKDVLEEIFPELRESEDEKIRKWLIGTIKQIPDDSIEWETICKSDVLAWLDRPSEEKPDDKFEPKFKVGDWVVNKFGDSWHIDSFDKKNYQVSDGKGNYNYFPISKQDEMRLWTIDDARDGDVLFDGNAACIFRKTMEDDDAIWVDTYCGINIDNEFKVNDEYECWCLSEDCSPATKEQREQLEKAMSDAGYTFDFDKKELKKIEDEPTQAIEFYDPYEAVVKSIAENGEETNGVYDKDILVWLEKQGNEKPATFISKFREGDWIVQENVGVYKVIEICESWYEVVDGEDNHYSISFDNEYMCRLWDITKDAKDGDVLCTGNGNLFIFKERIGDVIYDYCGYYNNIFYAYSGSPNGTVRSSYNGYKPATKEQHDLLFQKMKEADYEFDFDKKELKKIEDEPTQTIEFYDPYEAVVKSIAEMCKRYDRMDLDSLQDFYDNVKVKCKDAQEYVSLYPQNAKD